MSLATSITALLSALTTFKNTINTKIGTKLNTSEVGISVAPLVNGFIPASYIPASLEEVLEFNGVVNFPLVGDSTKIYIDTSDVDSDIYRWSGSTYFKINDSVSTSDKAGKLVTARNISLTGDGNWTVSFDGSANATAVFTLNTVPVSKGGTGATTALNARANLGLVIGTDVQTQNADLEAIADIVSTVGLLRKDSAGVWSLDNATYSLDTHNHNAAYAPLSHVGVGGAAHAVVTTAVNGFMSSTDKAKLDGVASGATANLGTVTSVGATSPLTSSGGNTPNLSMPASSSTVDGYLKATDFVAFAAKGSGNGTVTNVSGIGAISVTAQTTTPVISVAASTQLVPGTMSAADKTKLDAITGTNTGDETNASIISKLGFTPVANNTTVNGHSLTGAVTVTASDVGLGNVNNTSDVNKPVSTAQASADATVLASAKTYADNLVVGLWDDRGNFNASVNTFPGAGGSGSGGAILKGDIWTISTAGIVGGVPVAIRQTLRAMVDSPDQVAANWAIGLANTDIDDSITAGVTGRAPSQNAVSNSLTSVVNYCNSVAANASNLTSGTMPSGRLPAFLGDVSSSLGSSFLTLSTVNNNVGVFGGNNSIPVYNVDAKGRIIASSSVIPSGTWGISVSGNAASATKLLTARNINGVAFDGLSDINVNLINSLTFSTSGNGVASGSFNGNSATTISYNSVGAPSTTGAGASGVWDINVSGSSGSCSGNAVTATTAHSLAPVNNYQGNSIGVGTAPSGVAGEIRATGNITGYYSDDRLKTRINNLENSLDKVCALSGFIFVNNEIANKYGYNSTAQQVGVSAQEVQLVLPEAVTQAPFDTSFNEDGSVTSISGEKYLTVYYEKIVPLLIEAIKELRLEVNELKKSQ